MGTITDWVDDIRRLNFGFSVDEVMSGRHWFEPGCGPEGALFMRFSARWGPASIRDWAGSPWTQPLAGAVTVEGLAENAPMKGTLEFDYLGDHKLRYSFEFEAKNRKYRYVGEKVNIRPWNLPVSHTTCFGRLTEAASGKLVSTSVTFFKMLSAPSFLASFRLTHGARRATGRRPSPARSTARGT